MKYYVIILLVLVSFLSCDKNDSNDNDCMEQEIAYVTSINAPSTGTINKTIEVEVDFDLKNSCGSFKDFTESINGNSRTIEANAEYDGCICLQVIKSETITYAFEATTPGDYELKFMSGENEYIIVVITIE
ncbi:MAG: hypothetical protein ACTIJ9_09335 [Aequorivita sp.]